MMHFHQGNTLQEVGDFFKFRLQYYMVMHILADSCQLADWPGVILQQEAGIVWIWGCHSDFRVWSRIGTLIAGGRLLNLSSAIRKRSLPQAFCIAY